MGLMGNAGPLIFSSRARCLSFSGHMQAKRVTNKQLLSSKRRQRECLVLPNTLGGLLNSKHPTVQAPTRRVDVNTGSPVGLWGFGVGEGVKGLRVAWADKGALTRVASHALTMVKSPRTHASMRIQAVWFWSPALFLVWWGQIFGSGRQSVYS